MISKLSNDYKQLSECFKGNLLLSPYLWRTKYLGQVNRGCSTNDVVFIKGLKKLGLVCKIKESQLQIRYIDASGQARKQWFHKPDLAHLLSGSLFVNNPIPEHDVSTSINN